MPFNGSFSYKNNKKKVTTIDDNIKAVIENYDQTIAKLYLVNDKDIPINIPDDMSLRDVTNNINTPKVINDGIDSFLISWINNYSLFKDNVEILRLNNQKQQAVRIMKSKKSLTKAHDDTLITQYFSKKTKDINVNEKEEK